MLAESSAGLPVEYVVEDDSVATVSDGVLTLLSDGTTSITATASGDGYEPASKTLTLSVIRLDDHGNDFENATDLAGSIELESFIDGPNDLDVFAVTVPEGSALRVRTISDLDTIGRLLTDNGVIVDQSDDVLGDLNFYTECRRFGRWYLFH